MKSTALLIIDMQKGAAEMTKPKFHGMDNLIIRLEKLISRAREKGCPIFYAQHHNPNGFPKYGSSEWELITQIGPKNSDTVIHKTTPDIFYETNLHEKLQNQGIRKLIIGGIQTADCVDTTCRRAFSLNYEVVLIKDGHTTFDNSYLKAEQIIRHHNQIIENWFGSVVDSENILF